MSNLVWTMMEGQTGKVLRGQLRDLNGAVDLDGFASPPKVQVALSPASLLLVDLPVTPDADQEAEVYEGGRSVSGKGWFEVVTEETFADLPQRSEGYLLSFKGMNGSEAVYFPLNRNHAQTYGRLIVQDPLGA